MTDPTADRLTPLQRAQLGSRPLRRVLFSERQIQRRVGEMAQEISDAYDPADDLLILGLLKGSFIFIADLVRQIPRPIQVDFLAASSYGKKRSSSGVVRLLYNPEGSMEGRRVILVEDIVDTGATIGRIIPVLMERKPLSVEVCTLLHKRLAPLDWEPRWVGFDAPPDFVVGYGLDYGEDFRHLPFIGAI